MRPRDDVLAALADIAHAALARATADAIGNDIATGALSAHDDADDTLAPIVMPKPATAADNARRRRGRAQLAPVIANDPTQYIDRALATATEWHTERERDPHDAAAFRIRCLARGLRRLRDGAASTRANAARFLRSQVQLLAAGKRDGRFAEDGWSAVDDARLADLSAETLLAIGDRVELIDGRIVDPRAFADEQGRAA